MTQLSVNQLFYTIILSILCFSVDADEINSPVLNNQGVKTAAAVHSIYDPTNQVIFLNRMQLPIDLCRAMRTNNLYIIKKDTIDMAKKSYPTSVEGSDHSVVQQSPIFSTAIFLNPCQRATFSVKHFVYHDGDQIHANQVPLVGYLAANGNGWVTTKPCHAASTTKSEIILPGDLYVMGDVACFDLFYHGAGANAYVYEFESVIEQEPTEAANETLEPDIDHRDREELLDDLDDVDDNENEF